MIKKLTKELNEILEADNNIVNEYAWKLRDRNILFIDNIINKLSEMKEYNELSGLGSYLAGLAHTFDSVEDIINDFNDDLDKLDDYIELDSMEDIKSVSGWLDGAISRYDAILRQMGATK